MPLVHLFKRPENQRKIAWLILVICMLFNIVLGLLLA